MLNTKIHICFDAKHKSPSKYLYLWVEQIEFGFEIIKQRSHLVLAVFYELCIILKLSDFLKYFPLYINKI